MRDWLKILIAVGVGICVALTVALSVTLTREKPSDDDLGAQRFPDYNFVTFEDLWNGQLRSIELTIISFSNYHLNVVCRIMK